MGKNVVVKCVNLWLGNSYFSPMRDLTVGNEYKAYLPDMGEKDPYGDEVIYDNEVWIEADDVGDKVVVQLSDGLEIVGE